MVGSARRSIAERQGLQVSGVAFESTLQIVKRFAQGQYVGNRWYKGNLHVHGKGLDARKLIESTKQETLDFLAITDHQSFEHVERTRQAASSAGQALVIFPGIELTALEGVHLLAIFPPRFTEEQRTKLLGYLELSGSGNTAEASRRNVSEILTKVDEEGGIVVVPHPFSAKTGLLDSARKMSTRLEWLESGFVRLIQAQDDKIRYVDWDESGQWVNRYVLASATEEQIKSSSYCFAPINVSDCYKEQEVGAGCTWFRMGEVSIDGFKQVACEPAGRISRTPPPSDIHDAILCVRIAGGFCDKQTFLFNSGLNCIIGQNHAGKSAVFDFIRFALRADLIGPVDARASLVARLRAILGVGGVVELIIRHSGCFYVLKRSFQDANKDDTKYFQFEMKSQTLVPVEPFRFPVEVYEQGRIHRLRDDMPRQLEMLDEFAGLLDLRRQQDELVAKLHSSANEIEPLKGRLGRLSTEVAELPKLEAELAQKEELLPKEAEERPWASAAPIAQGLTELVTTLTNLSGRIEQPEPSEEFDAQDPIWELFNQQVPELGAAPIAHRDLFEAWISAAEDALSKVRTAQTEIVEAVRTLKIKSEEIETRWNTLRQEHESATGQELAKAGVDSPQELLNRVNDLRGTIHQLKSVKQPQIDQLTRELREKEDARRVLLTRLDEIDREMREARSAKAQELTNMFGGLIEVSLTLFGDRIEYKNLLTELYSRISSREQQIKNIDAQLSLVADKLTPRELAQALQNRGLIVQKDGTSTELATFCGITWNTQSVLCTIAGNIKLLNRLQTARTPDVLRIRVRRQGESAYADLTTGLSPGEQSAALLTLTMQSRAIPLVLDQPEDELGYNYVVNLIVPKVMKAKLHRQMLVITHNANVPVLGDADYVMKMENRPKPGGGRECVLVQEGCFESPRITGSLLELEGGRRAFEFRRHRYSLSN